MKRLAFFLLTTIVLMTAIVFPVSAQDDDTSNLEQFSFPNGYGFAYSADTWKLDEATVSDFFVMLQAKEAFATFLQVYELTNLYGGMEMELDFVLETYGNNAAGTWAFDFAVDDFEAVDIDGRELYVLAFEGTQNDSSVAGYIVVVPYSTEGYGQITTYAVGDPPENYEESVLAIAASFDIEALDITDAVANTPHGEAEEEPAEVVELGDVDLPNRFTFSGGAEFLYPDTWVLNEDTASDFFAMLQAEDAAAAFLQVNELTSLFGGMEMELDTLLEIYGDMAADSWSFDFAVEDFKTIEVNSRELLVLAFESIQDDRPVTGYVVIVPYSSSGHGQIMAYAFDAPPDNFERDVLAVAASFDLAEPAE